MVSKLILIRGLRLSYHSFGFQNIKWILNQAKYSAEWRKLQALVLHQNVKGSQKNNHCFQFVSENINSRQVKSLLWSLEGETVPWGGKHTGHFYVQWHFTIQDRCKNGHRQLVTQTVPGSRVVHLTLHLLYTDIHTGSDTTTNYFH